ncbi:MAG: hypothetical protein ACERKD_17740 [Prolixibacteraceae bacterium]
MEEIAVNMIIEELKIKSENYQKEVEVRILGKCPFIIQIGALTITTDESGKVITHNTDTPTQFSKKAIDEILTMTFKDGNGVNLIPKVYSRVEWYNLQMNEVNIRIKLLEEISNRKH